MIILDIPNDRTIQKLSAEINTQKMTTRFYTHRCLKITHLGSQQSLHSSMINIPSFHLAQPPTRELLRRTWTNEPREPKYRVLVDRFLRLRQRTRYASANNARCIVVYLYIHKGQTGKTAECEKDTRWRAGRRKQEDVDVSQVVQCTWYVGTSSRVLSHG